MIANLDKIREMHKLLSNKNRVNDDIMSLFCRFGLHQSLRRLGMEKQQPTIFIFDEPTTGLHFRDIKKLLASFDALIERGHTIIIIEHNMDIIKCADYVIDLGPEGGEAGGNIVACGTPEEIAECKQSYTGKYLKKEKKLTL